MFESRGRQITTLRASILVCQSSCYGNMVLGNGSYRVFIRCIHFFVDEYTWRISKQLKDACYHRNDSCIQNSKNLQRLWSNLVGFFLEPNGKSVHQWIQVTNLPPPSVCSFISTADSSGFNTTTVLDSIHFLRASEAGLTQSVKLQRGSSQRSMCWLMYNLSSFRSIKK